MQTIHYFHSKAFSLVMTVFAFDNQESTSMVTGSQSLFSSLRAFQRKVNFKSAKQKIFALCQVLKSFEKRNPDELSFLSVAD